MELELVIETKETGVTETRRLTLDRRLALGRGPESPVVLDGPGLSRDHLAFEADTSAVYVLDLSANGTWLNGRRLTAGKRQPVTSADRIEIPGYTIRCLASPPAPAKSAAVPAEPERNAVQAALASITPLEMWTVVFALAAVAVVAIFWKV